MSVYQTDEEQVEAIKKWWQENGRSVVIGAVIGFGIIGGWQGWERYQRVQGEGASGVYEQMLESGRQGDTDRTLAAGKRLLGDYPNSAYASFAALEMAHLAYKKGEKEAARGHLEWVHANAPDRALRETARLRLVRVLLDIGDLDAAASALEGDSETYSGELALLRGDVARARNDLATARAAYQQALASGVANPSLLRMKLVDAGAEQPAG